MGVEYAHYLLAADPNWLGGIEVARRVHEVLSGWDMVSEWPALFELTGGRTRRLRGSPAEVKKPPVNLLVRYPMVSGVPNIARITGPSYYDEAQIGPRYIKSIGLVVGTDFRIGPISEQLDMDVIRPPLRDRTEVAPYPTASLLWEFDDSYPADAVTTPPGVRLAPAGRFPAGFAGVWRGGLMLDCGKDLPRVEESQPLQVDAAFAEEIEGAFGTRLVQIGRIY